jgi:hypothetical protein
MKDGSVKIIRERNNQHCIIEHLPSFHHRIIKAMTKRKVEFITNDEIRNSCIRLIADCEKILEQRSQRIVT